MLEDWAGSCVVCVCLCPSLSAMAPKSGLGTVFLGAGISMGH